MSPRITVAALLDGLFPGWTGGVRTLAGAVLPLDEALDQAGLVDGSVLVIGAEPGGARPFLPDDVGAGAGDLAERRSRGVRPATRHLAGRLVVSWGLAVSIIALAVVGLPTVEIAPVGAAVLLLAIGASVGRVVPDLVLRGSVPAGLGVVEDDPPDSVPAQRSVEKGVRRLADRLLVAHLGVLVAALVAGGVLLVAAVRMPVGTGGSGSTASGPVDGWDGWVITVPVLVSVLASAVALVGSARGRSRVDSWILRGAALAALGPVVVAVAASLSAPAAVVAASGSVVVGLALLSPVGRRRRSPRPRPRGAQVVEVLTVVAVLPLACWAAGLVSAAQGWASAVLP